MKSIYSIILLFTTSIITHAQDYDELIHGVIINNPEIAALQSAVESDIMSLKSENNLPDTEVGFEHQWGRKEIGTKWSFAISQGFEWPGVYGARSQEYKSASEAMQFLNRSNYLDKMLDVKLLFVDIVSARKNIEIANEVLTHMTQLKEKYQKGYQQGEVSLLDVNKINIEYVAASRRCNELNTQLTVLKNSLQALNGGKDCSDIMEQLVDYPQDMVLSVEDYTEHIKQNDPLLKYKSLMTQSQIARTKIARLKNLPGFSLGYMHVNELGEHFNGVKFGLSLPLFSNRNKTNAAKSMLKSMEYSEDNAEIVKLSQMYSDRAKVLSLYDEMIDYQPIFEKNNNIELLKKALDGGEISLLNYLQEVNYFLSAQQQYLDVVYQYHYALARLNRYSLIK